MTEENRQAHRSTLAAASETALAIEQSDPHTSVTFVMLSASGASIDQGLLGPEAGIEDPAYTLPAQIAELKQIIGSRKIDVLTLSVGGNDIGFSDVIQRLLTLPIAGALDSIAKIESDVSGRLAALSQSYQALAQALTPFSIGKIVITDYPSPTHNENGQISAFASDFVPFLEVTQPEAAFAEAAILTPLNAIVAKAAATFGWQDVKVEDAFLTHGYPAKDSWFVTESQARLTEGIQFYVPPFGIPISAGGLHPNAEGQAAIEGLLLATIKPDVT